MKRRLTVAQRQALIKWGCFLLSSLLFLSALAAVPYIVSVIPKVSAKSRQNIFYGNAALATDVPKYQLGAGEYDSLQENESFDPEGEFEPEEPIPIPEASENDLPVTPSNLAWYTVSDNPSLNIINRTKFNISLDEYIKKPFPIDCAIPDSEPLVLIIHTHGSESYLENGYDFYSPEETFRSLDAERGVVRIGEVLCEKLNSLGISTLHDKTMYDQTDFNRSYSYSRAGVQAVLEKYPTVQFVIDLHRDSVFDSDGKNIKPLTTLNGKECAQLMLVVGTNGGGSDHPNWRDNLTFATHLQQKMNDLYPTLARPLNLRSAAFNQALAKGSLLLEVGSCGNTLEEAENAVLLFAQAYASLLKENLK